MRALSAVAALAALLVLGSSAAGSGNRPDSILPAAPWTNIGPEGGDVTAVAVDPTTPTTLYAGIAGGGVFKSTNSGASWAPVGVLPGGAGLDALAVDPTAHSKLYAGGFNGLYVSTNSGQDWTASAPFGDQPVSAIAFDPDNGARAYAGSPFGGGVFVTTNGGSSWSNTDTGLTNKFVTDVIVSPSTPATLYATTNGGGVFVSTDSGGSWTPVNTGLTSTGIASVAVDPTNAQSVWAATEPVPTIQETVFHSTDGGAHWSSAGTGLPAPTSAPLFPAAAPLLVTSQKVFVGVESKGLYEEAIDGATFTRVTSGLTNPDGLATENVYSLAAPQISGELYEGINIEAGTEDGGMFGSTNGGSSWTHHNTGLLANGIQTIAGVDSNPNVVFAATDTLGLFVSHDGGTTWSNATATMGASIDAIDVDPTHPATVWAGGELNGDGALFKSTDGGAHWTKVSAAPIGDITSIAVDPFNSNVIWLGTFGDGVYKTTNDGASWPAANTGLTVHNVTVLTADPATNGLLYAGTDSAGVFKSTNGAGSWTHLTTSGLANKYILSIADGDLEVGTGAGAEFLHGGTWEPVKLVFHGHAVTVNSCYIWQKSIAWHFGNEEEPTYVFGELAQCGQQYFWKGDDGWVQTDDSWAATATNGFAGDPLWLVGTPGNDMYALPSSAPIFSAAATSTTATGSARATVPTELKANGAGSLSAAASSGKGTVSAYDYFANPSTAQTPVPPTNFFRVGLSSGNTFHSVSISDCQNTDSHTAIYRLSGSTWAKVSNETYNATTGCVTVTVNTSTTPTLANLVGKVFFASTG